MQQKTTPSAGRLSGKLSAISFHLILILAASAGNYFLMSQVADREQLEDSQAFGKQVATLIDRHGQAWINQTVLLAQQPALKSEASIKAVISADGVVPPSLSYATQDLINRSKTTVTGPEVVIENNAPVINVVRAMPTGGYVVAQFSFEPLTADLKAITPPYLHVRLNQTIGAANTEIIRVNDLGNDGVMRAVAVKLSGWQLSVASNRQSQAPLWAALMTLLAGLMSLIPWLLRRDRVVAQTLAAPSTASHATIKDVDAAPSPIPATPAIDLGKTELASAPVSVALEPVAAQTTTEADSTSAVSANIAVIDTLPEVAATPATPEESPRELEFSLDDILLPDLQLSKTSSGFPAHLFRAYDIRGSFADFGESLWRDIGRALGSTMREQNQYQVVVGHDVRTHSHSAAHWVIEGLIQSGLQVIDLGQTATPVMHFAARQHDGNGVMITASHCPASDNGVKWVINNHPPMDSEIAALCERIQAQQFVTGSGSSRLENYTDSYQDSLLGDVILGQTFNIALEGMNGSMGSIAAATLRAAGCQVSALNTEPDGHFPHGDPDPSKTGRLDDLCNDVIIAGADIGFAFDGDGDRLVVVDGEGQIVSPDQLIAIFAQMVLETKPGADIIFDVKCSRMLNAVITESGGRPVMIRSGNTFIRQAIQSPRYDAAFGAEFSGHYFFNDGRGHDNDDALYAALRLLEWLDQRGQTISELVKSLPQRIGTPDQYLPLQGSDARQLLADIQHSAESLGQGQLSLLDGIRLDFDDGFGIIRASNTGPYLTARFDGDNPEALHRIRQVFHGLVAPHHPTLANHLTD